MSFAKTSANYCDTMKASQMIRKSHLLEKAKTFAK